MDPLGRLQVFPALERPDLLGAPVALALAELPFADEIGVLEIDPEFADTAAMSQRYDVPMEGGANCVVVMGKRDGIERTAACVVRADTRADVNNVVKRTLDVRKCSFLAQERAVAESGMAYGGITPIGLPTDWRLLVDALACKIDRAILGSGIRNSKLLVPGALLSRLPRAEVLPDLALAPSDG